MTETTNLGIGDRLLLITIFSLILYKACSFGVFLILFTVLIGLLFCVLFYEHQYWQNLGVPGPTPNILFGNTFQQLRRGAINFDPNAFAKHGKFYGYARAQKTTFTSFHTHLRTYLFDRHEFSTMDLGMMKSIFIKNFRNFQNRFMFAPAQNKKNLEKNFLRNVVSIIRDEHWRRVRSQITPAFTTGKLKKLIPILCESTNHLCDAIQRDFIEKNKGLPIKELFGLLVLDEIGHACFSIDFETFKEGEPSNFLKKTTSFIKEMFSSRRGNIMLLILALFPYLMHFLEKFFAFDVFRTESHIFYENLMNDLYEQRRADPESSKKYNDIFQLLMNAVDEQKANPSKALLKQADLETDAEIIHDELWTQSSGPTSAKYLSRIELFGQAILFLIVGHDTTASALHFIIYMLTIHQNVQERLRDEIRDTIGDGKEITYEMLKRMDYMQAVVQETLRYYPPAPKMNRVCNEDIEINGIPLCRGDIISLPIYAIHHCEEFYPEPEKFDPERFMPPQKTERDPLTFVPFGLGPRNCIGMRFAEFQIYVALTILIHRFRFKSAGDKTPALPLELKSVDFLRPVQEIFVIAEKIE